MEVSACETRTRRSMHVDHVRYELLAIWRATGGYADACELSVPGCGIFVCVIFYPVLRWPLL